MHTDDHILETLVAADRPLAAIAADLRMSFIALVKWMDAHADLIAIATRALESHLKLLALRAEAVALVDLTAISTSTPDPERKRKSASQLLRHTAKRLFTNPTREPLHKLVASGVPPVPTSSTLAPTNPTRERGAPCATASPADSLQQLASVSPSAASASSASSPKPSLADRFAARRLAAMNAPRAASA